MQNTTDPEERTLALAQAKQTFDSEWLRIRDGRLGVYNEAKNEGKSERHAWWLAYQAYPKPR